MLTVRTLRVAKDEARRAVEPLAAPGAFVRPEDPPDRLANTMWVGAAEALGCLGLKAGTEAKTGALAAAIAGQHTISGARVRGDGAAFDLTFLVPPSVSWVWAQGRADLRVRVEKTVVDAAYHCLQYLIWKLRGDSVVAVPGFAAAVALHAVGQPQHQAPPPPLLHVHSYLVGVLDEFGELRGPRRSSLFEDDVVLASGAFGRAKLAEDLRGLGFGTEVVSGRDGRLSFEISGVPEGLLRVGESADKGCAGLGQETDHEPWEPVPPEPDPWEPDPWETDPWESGPWRNG
ncbi:relaxase domain-containing protein [Streptomyces sp. NPDC047043]|uniref:relaxase domain-containing protein n=1 Tax=Streptomyces sp. NPDC047043 TaxID=3154497 RepID=UPI0034108D03